MKSWISALVVGFSVLGFTSGSAAQDELSARERDYAADLAGALGPSSEFTARRVHLPYPGPDTVDGLAAPPTAPSINGVAVEMDGLIVERLRFETPEQAQAITDRLLSGDLAGLRPVAGQLRGNQLVVLHGKGVADPDLAKRMLERAWEGLPAPKRTSDAAFTQLEDGSVAVTTTLEGGPLRESIDRALAAAREREAAAKTNPASGTITTTPTSARIEFPSGFRAGLQADGQGASLYTAESTTDEDVMKRHLEALGGHPGPRGPTEGTAKIIERLFGR